MRSISKIETEVDSLLWMQVKKIYWRFINDDRMRLMVSLLQNNQIERE